MQTLISACPVCDAEIPVEMTTEESEILHCPDCRTRLVAGKIENDSIPLTQAPAIEEDWGQ